MSNAIAVLDAARERLGPRAEELMGSVFGRISFFVNAGVRFVEEHAKLRAMGILWEELGRERYGVEDPRHLRFRYGVQVNSLGLTEAQPENNIQRIVPEPRSPAKLADIGDNTCMPRVHTIELLIALVALLLGQIALLCEVPAINEPSAMLSSIAFGLLVARLSDSRRSTKR